MKLINILKKTFWFMSITFVVSSCEDDIEITVPYPKDITFNDIKLNRFSFEIRNNPFEVGSEESGVLIFNAIDTGNGEFSGFAISNKNWRSYPWSLSPDFGSNSLTPIEKQAAIDSTEFSVFTNTPNRTGNFLVGNTENENAFFSLKEPRIIEHILVANTTYNYLLSKYGTIYSGTLDQSTLHNTIDGEKVRNIKIPNTSTNRYGRFFLPGPEDSKLLSLENHEKIERVKAGSIAADIARSRGASIEEIKRDSVEAANATNKGFIKLIIEGYNQGNKTGEINYYMGVRPKANPLNLEHNVILDDWYKVDLTQLGSVDKVLFKMTSSYVNNEDNMLYPSLFCLDGIRLRK
ncbi:DUF4465 domain-containing protein [Cellulophaga omnivescoria]|uniref:DUF4465 domain-containing protein n=1 Tax=Cellulophaga omnivescoria TaxID=1888890 RepID=UPI000987D23C|nr:DUF4465 domain-containing protein [Cellulophaga omnivescoria]